MGWLTDWLDPNRNGEVTGKGKYRAPAPFFDVCCSSCNETEKRCKCDPKLGRPRKWYE